MKNLTIKLLVASAIILPLALSLVYYKYVTNSAVNSRDSDSELVLSNTIKSPVLYNRSVDIPDEHKIILKVGNIDMRQGDPMISQLSKLNDDTVVYILVQVDDPVKNINNYDIVKDKLESLNA